MVAACGAPGSMDARRAATTAVVRRAGSWSEGGCQGQRAAVAGLPEAPRGVALAGAHTEGPRRTRTVGVSAV